MVLVLYCGAVIFVTKPNSFAYDAIFGNEPARSIQSQPAATTVETASAVIDTDAIIAEVTAAAEKRAQEISASVAAQAGAEVRKALEDSIPAMVDEAVKKAIADYALDEQIAKKVSEEMARQQDGLVAKIYESYGDSVIRTVTDDVLDSLLISEVESKTAEAADIQEVATEPVKEEPSEITVEEYEAIRQEIREAEINSLLEKLGE